MVEERLRGDITAGSRLTEDNPREDVDGSGLAKGLSELFFLMAFLASKPSTSFWYIKDTCKRDEWCMESLLVCQCHVNGIQTAKDISSTAHHHLSGEVLEADCDDLMHGGALGQDRETADQTLPSPGCEHPNRPSSFCGDLEAFPARTCSRE